MIEAVVIQNFFRFGGSYLYNQIIESNNNIAGFYEPFHEHLSDHKRVKKEEEIFLEKSKRLRHFSKNFYFSNFPFEFDWFQNFHTNSNLRINHFDHSVEDVANCKEYLNGLIEHAQQKNLLPVFKINRIYFSPQILELKKTFNIFLIRQPVSSFFSNIDLNFLKPYYENINIQYMRNLQPFYDLWQIIENKNLKEISIKNNQLYFEGKEQLMLHYSIFFFLWIFGLSKNIGKNNLMINYDYLSNEEYSNSIQKEFNIKTNLFLNLDSFKKTDNKLHKMELNVIKEVCDLINKYIDCDKLKDELKKKNCENLLIYMP